MQKLIFQILMICPILLFSQSDFEIGKKLFVQGNYASAKPILENVIKETPNHLTALEYLGDIEGNNKSWDKAMEYYGKLIALKPTEANYHYKYGGCLGMKAKESSKFKALGMIDDVKGCFEKAIQLNPNHIEARWALIELYLQLPGIVGGSEKKAQRYANELAKISPVDFYLAKGRIAEYFNRYKEAERNYKLAIEIGGSKTTYQKLANLYKHKMNQPEKAKLLLETYKEKTNP
ncbi:tetratricopeptide repeat protein [Flavobacterium sedimenticola]|uniref:Tetratricopeptide repeat protein n=1 Tax=Flavobacterium sedimenticola TaxID=3043286 RepID=A0ABT6XSH0_9FLAO|nr:tetratricopeptide repeat protein [Flavobacterium sedimenticola]MDI9258043.1 tetratricopeptide repeat protein [Flavobacterium sedimenticola]